MSTQVVRSTDRESQATTSGRARFRLQAARCVLSRRSVSDLSCAARARSRSIACRTDRIFLSRYDDCAAVYRDPDTWSSDKKVDFRPNLGTARSTSITPPAWCSTIRPTTAGSASCWRRPSRRAPRRLQPRIEALVDRLLDRAAARGSIDLIADFAAAIPLQLIGDMLGVPGRRARLPARLVARDPRRARAGPDPEQFQAAPRRSTISSSICATWWRAVRASSTWTRARSCPE